MQLEAALLWGKVWQSREEIYYLHGVKCLAFLRGLGSNLSKDVSLVLLLELDLFLL